MDSTVEARAGDALLFGQPHFCPPISIDVLQKFSGNTCDSLDPVVFGKRFSFFPMRFEQETEATTAEEAGPDQNTEE